MRAVFMKAQEEVHDVNEMAKMLKVNQSGDYRRRGERRSVRGQQDAVLG